MASSLRSPLGRVRGLGSAKSGVEHWKYQRLTAIAAVFLVVWFVFQAVGMAGSGYAEWQAWFRSPIHAGLMALLVITLFWHARLGIQVVLEDYVHHPVLKIGSLVLNYLLTTALMGVCVVSILIIATRG